MEPINTPINFCFAPGGTDTLNHAVDILLEDKPDHILGEDDIFNMYNEMDKEASSDAMGLRPRTATLMPVYAFFYADPAVIRLVRADGQLIVEVTQEEYIEGKSVIGDMETEAVDSTFFTFTDEASASCAKLNVKRSPASWWTSEEDTELRNLVEKFGPLRWRASRALERVGTSLGR